MTEPPFGETIPIIILKDVVLPAPLRPSNPTMLRRSIVMDTPLTTVLPEYRFFSSRVSRRVISLAIVVSHQINRLRHYNSGYPKGKQITASGRA